MRPLAAWTLYLLGDFVFQIFSRADFLASVLYPVYHRLMGWSDSIQGTGRGAWFAIEDEEP